MEEYKKLLDETIAKLDGEQYAGIRDYLSALSSGEEDEKPVEAMEHLQEMKPLPQIVWDMIIEILKSEIEKGNADAMNDLGAMYYDGTGCEQSFKKAVYYYKMAAANGSRQAQENLGYCYYYGRNMPVDYEKAFNYFAMGAFDGHLISLYKIGDMYANGYYVEKNEKEAFIIYMHCINTMTEEAAKFVAGPIYLRLGRAFLNGRGVVADPRTALSCFQKAELYLYDMVQDGDDMYRKSLQAAINGEAEARSKLMDALPANKWKF